MKQIVLSIVLSVAFALPVSAQELFTELQAKVDSAGELYTFRVLGDKEDGAFTAYGIHVIAPDGSEQMLDEFDALLPEGSEADALYVEDVNFDGYADLRVMKYQSGGANVPYFFWLFDRASGKFVGAEAYEAIVSLEVDNANKELISRQRSSATQYTIDYYKPNGSIPTLVRREERSFQADGSSELKRYDIKDGSEPVLVETKTLGPEQ